MCCCCGGGSYGTDSPTESPTPVPPVDCYGFWGRWRQCSVSCGQGIKKRSYKILTEKEGQNGKDCDTLKFKTNCWTGPCPTPAPPTLSPTPSPTESPTEAPTKEELFPNCTYYLSGSPQTDSKCLKHCNDPTA